MKEGKQDSPVASTFQQKAEEQLKRKHSAKTSPLTARNDQPALNLVQGSEVDTLKLLHELQEYQVELKMQNEQLQLAADKAATAIALYDFAPVGYFTLGRDGIICQLNLGGARMLGKNRSGLVNRKFELFVTHLALPVFNDFFRKVFESDSKQTCEVRFAINGNPSIFAHIEGIKSENEQKCLLTAVDITERKQAEETIRRAEENFRRSIDESPLGIRIVTANGETLYANRAILEIYGYESIEELETTPTKKRYTPESYAEFKIRLGKRQQGEHLSQEYEISIVRKNGELRHLQVFRKEVLWNGEKQSQVIYIDITERKQTKLELIAAKGKAEESNRLKSSFLANMSHELRTPLNSIIGFSELLLDPHFGSDQHIEFAQMINESGNNLLAIITDIMDISKIEAGQVHVKKCLFSVNKLMIDIQKEYSFKTIEKGIELRLDLTNPEEEVFIESDEPRLRQILVNHVFNSIKFTENGFIELGIKTIGDFVQFHVKDTGIGIPAEFHETIFERFRQVQSGNTRQYGGNGLGLPISKSLVELLGGKIWMESEQGKGSIFYFTIPIRDIQRQSVPN
jgi:PAS domain S-box-containing protein